MTPRQAEILSLVQSSLEMCGVAPSLEEIAEAVGVSSIGTVHAHVNRLVRDGHLIRTGHNRSRSLELPTIECPACHHEFQRGEPRAGVPCRSSTEPGPLEGAPTGGTP